MPRTEHRQDLFIDYLGNTVEVDEKLLNILISMRDLGVRTNFSCQGEMDDLRAYIQIQTRTLPRFLKCIFHMIKTRSYSKDTKGLLKSFLKGNFEFRIRIMDMGFQFEKQGLYHSEYHIETSYMFRHGFRTCIRWPSTETHRVETFLKEIM